MAQLRATNALEPFVLLSKSATHPRGAADLITQATSAPNTYVFAELLQTPNIQALRNSQEYEPYLKLLEIFAWGNFSHVQGLPRDPNLPKLSPAQTQKIKLLSLLPLARLHSPLPYSTLQTALELPDIETLEALVTSAISASLITGTLDSQAAVVHVDSIAPLRDLGPGTLPELTNEFDAWSTRCATVLSELAAEEERIRQTAQLRAERQERATKLFDKRVQAEQGGGADDKGGRGKRGLDDKEASVDDEDAMDVDGENGRMKGIKRTLLGGMNKIMGQ
ncbi:hypothetical protein BT63DRAFT_374611 [Microthyrium microscopicum]|uniref:PCI domain-containing protein n=1 Tax=Microthyrium microscopicum TaxID=703497 RepID=A0A6A6U8V9_9PEZI|nr:hypothetical protein BT63DRAFT_374611 [Microthyrium microscopicum]